MLCPKPSTQLATVAPNQTPSPANNGIVYRLNQQIRETQALASRQTQASSIGTAKTKEITIQALPKDVDKTKATFKELLDIRSRECSLADRVLAVPDYWQIRVGFVTESSYTQVYPPQIIESIEVVLVGILEIYVSYTDADGEEISNDLVLFRETYAPVVTRESVEVEAVEVQTMSYLFPFSCVPDSMGRLKLSL